MTVVAALIGEEGIVCIGDGFAHDMEGNLAETDVTKLFELSRYCVVMPNGGVMSNIVEVMGFVRSVSENNNIINITTIAQTFADTLKRARGFDKENPYGFIFAGCDIQEDGQVTPQLYDLDSTDWVLKVPTHPYLIGGIIEPALTVFNEGYKSANGKVRNLNILALKAMKVSTETHSDVGGKVALWNITATGRIKKYDQKGINKLFEKVHSQHLKSIA